MYVGIITHSHTVVKVHVNSLPDPNDYLSSLLCQDFQKSFKESVAQVIVNRPEWVSNKSI